jgi:hypothetical protein
VNNIFVTNVTDDVVPQYPQAPKMDPHLLVGADGAMVVWGQLWGQLNNNKIIK